MLVFKKVITSAEAEILRNIRNECKDFMTRSTSFITEEQQQAWFKTAHERYDLYIAYSVEHGAVVVDAGAVLAAATALGLFGLAVFLSPVAAVESAFL